MASPAAHRSPHRLGRFETAIGAYREALGLVLTTGDRHLESAILERLAATQEAYGHVDDARRGDGVRCHFATRWIR